jgi:hypothetical protein
MYEDWLLLELCARSDPQSAAVLASSDCTAVRAAVFTFGMVALAGLASPVDLYAVYPMPSCIPDAKQPTSKPKG